jgi:hypothetical protein
MGNNMSYENYQPPDEDDDGLGAARGVLFAVLCVALMALVGDIIYCLLF